MRLAGRMAPGSGAGPFTGHKLAASALSTTKPFRPPVQVFLAGLAAAVDLAVPDLAVDDFAADGFAVDDLADEVLLDPFSRLPNESARACDCVVFAG